MKVSLLLQLVIIHDTSNEFIMFLTYQIHLLEWMHLPYMAQLGGRNTTDRTKDSHKEWYGKSERCLLSSSKSLLCKPG